MDALGAAVKTEGCITEDISWLRKGDSSHINMAELDAVIKGFNLALLTDSSPVFRLISDSLSGKNR